MVRCICETSRFPIARGLSLEGHCNFLMGDVLPHETENTVYRYLIAISKLRLGILTEQGDPFFRSSFIYLFIYLFIQVQVGRGNLGPSCVLKWPRRRHVAFGQFTSIYKRGAVP